MSYKSDAETLAKTILEWWEEYDDGDYSPRGYYCEFCDGDSWVGHDAIVHDLDCPVLVAKDILTRAGE